MTIFLNLPISRGVKGSFPTELGVAAVMAVPMRNRCRVRCDRTMVTQVILILVLDFRLWVLDYGCEHICIPTLSVSTFGALEKGVGIMHGLCMEEWFPLYALCIIRKNHLGLTQKPPVSPIWGMLNPISPHSWIKRPKSDSTM